MIRCVDDDSGAAAVGKVVGAAVGLDVVIVLDVPVTLTLTPLAWSAAGKRPGRVMARAVKHTKNAPRICKLWH